MYRKSGNFLTAKTAQLLKFNYRLLRISPANSARAV
jgi:hypothetical protein